MEFEDDQHSDMLINGGYPKWNRYVLCTKVTISISFRYYFIHEYRFDETISRFYSRMSFPTVSCCQILQLPCIVEFKHR